MLKYCLLLLFILCCFDASAGKKPRVGNITFKNAVVDPDPPPYADFKTLAVPIKRAGNLIIVEATVDSLEGNFVLDTGAPYLVLNETYFRDAPKIEDQNAGGINGTDVSSFKTRVHNFKILDLQYSSLTADVTDLSFIENGRHIKILGLLGNRLFNKFAITVDLFRNIMYIQKLDRDGNIPEAERVYNERFMISPFHYLNDVIFIKGNFNKSNLWFAFDTASETNFLDYKKSKKFLDSITVINRAKVTGIGGSAVEIIYARLDHLIVGDGEFMRNRVLLANLDNMGKSYGYSVDGILGYDFFVRGIFTVNYVRKEFEMYIYTN